MGYTYLGGSSSYDFHGSPSPTLCTAGRSTQRGTVGMTSDGGKSPGRTTSPASHRGRPGRSPPTRAASGIVGAAGPILSRPIERRHVGAADVGDGAYLYGRLPLRRPGSWPSARAGPCLDTVDGGTTWTAALPRPSPHFQDIDVRRRDSTAGPSETRQNTSDAVIYATAATVASPGSGSCSTTLNWFGRLSTFADATHGWAVGWGGGIYPTTNGGTWQTAVCRPPMPNHELSTAWPARHAARLGGRLAGQRHVHEHARHHDGGTTWARGHVGTTERLNDVTFADSTHGWAVGDAGTIVATERRPPLGAAGRRASTSDLKSRRSSSTTCTAGPSATTAR